MNLSRLLVIVLVIDVALSFSSDLLGAFGVPLRPGSLVALSDIEPRIPEGVARTAGYVYFAALFAAYIGVAQALESSAFPLPAGLAHLACPLSSLGQRRRSPAWVPSCSCWWASPVGSLSVWFSARPSPKTSTHRPEPNNALQRTGIGGRAGSEFDA